MRLIRVLLLAVLAVTGLSAHAAAAAGDEQSVKRLTELLGQAQTMTGRFSQLTLDGSGRRPSWPQTPRLLRAKRR